MIFKILDQFKVMCVCVCVCVCVCWGRIFIKCVAGSYVYVAVLLQPSEKASVKTDERSGYAITFILFCQRDFRDSVAGFWTMLHSPLQCIT